MTLAFNGGKLRAVGGDTRHVTGLEQVMASPAGLLEGQRLALVDVVNSATWILIVILLEIEVGVLTRWGGASAHSREWQTP